MRSRALASCVLVTVLLLQPDARAEDEDLLFDAVTHPAIGYATAPLHDPVAELVRRMQSGDAHLIFDDAGAGYLRSLLDALRVPIESQMAVFSKTSLQSPIIAPANPRTIFFTDNVAVAWPQGGFIEIAAHDPQQGVQFYMLDQRNMAPPPIVRAESVRPGTCLNCHQSFATQGVPGLLIKSVEADSTGRIQPQVANYLTDDRSPLEERWAGWYVTGRTGSARHLGKALASLAGVIDTTRYLTPYSDIAALLVFDHQARLINLLTRTSWDARIATADRRDADVIIQRDARELADALLFVDEAPLPDGIRSSSGFPEAFAARGPRDTRGRSLRQLDLHGRLMRYPCSYMIYTDAFDSLPAASKDAVYRRLWAVLSGADAASRYARLSPADRRAIVDILRDTKPDLPRYWR